MILEWIVRARSWHPLIRIGIATLCVAATTILQLPVEADFPGQPFLLYFVAVVAVASVLGRTAGFVAAAGTAIASLLFYAPVYSLRVAHAVDLLAIEVYAVVAVLSVEAFCRLLDGAISAHTQFKEAEARLADSEIRLRMTRDSEARFRATFDNAAVGIAHVAIDGRWLRVNEALCRILGYELDELLTKSIHDLIHPGDRAADLAQVERICEQKADSYEAEERYIRKDGELIWGRKTVGCVRKGDESIDYFIVIIEDISRRKQAEQELRENEERFRSSLLYCPLPIALFDDREQILAVSQSWLEQSGYSREELLRLEDWTIRAYGERSGEMLDQIRQIIVVISTKPEARSSERLISTKDGRQRRWNFVVSPFAVQSDGRRLFICVAQDVTDQRAHEEQIHLLMREINHRSKNMLSLVQAVARQTAAREPEDFIERFTDRIQALAANQDLLVRNEWQGVELDDLVRVQLAHFADLVGTRITVHGPPVRLNAAAAQAIGLALHELSTNAGKYGALSVDTGCVDVSWRRDDLFAMSWTECRGPPVSQPKHRGFGSTVIDQMVKQTLNGEVRLDYAPSGVVWNMVCSAMNVLEWNPLLESPRRPASAEVLRQKGLSPDAPYLDGVGAGRVFATEQAIKRNGQYHPGAREDG